MAYGQTDDIVKLSKQLDEALKVLVSVAMGNKSVEEVQAWLEAEWPEECYEKEHSKKW